MLVHARTDAISGQPDSKATPASVAPVSYRYRGFLLSRAPLPLTCEYWVRIAQEGGWLYLIAMDDVPGASWRAWFLSLVDAADGDLLELSDRQGAHYRAALVHGQRLTAAAVLTEADELPASAWLAALLARIRHRCRHPARASGRQNARHRSGLRADRLRLLRRRPQPDRRGDHRREACLRRGHRPPPESRDQLRLVCSRTTAHPRRCHCRSRLKRALRRKLHKAEPTESAVFLALSRQHFAKPGSPSARADALVAVGDFGSLSAIDQASASTSVPRTVAIRCHARSDAASEGQKL